MTIRAVLPRAHSITRDGKISMEFYDVRVGAAIISSHKTLRKACLVQQKAPGDRRVVLASLDGTKWYDLREYSAKECREVVQDVEAKHFGC